MSAKAFCYRASRRVMAGIEQDLKLQAGLNYRPTGYNSARVLTLKLADINPYYLPQILGLRDKLTMWAGLDSETKVRISFQGTNILIEIPKPPQYWKQVTIERLQSRRAIRKGLVATLGEGLQDDPRRIDFREAAMAHVFITGQTRSGKTNTQRLIGWNIAHNTTPNEAQIVILDVAKRGYRWRDFAGVTHLAHPVVIDVPGAEGILAWMTREIERRALSGQITPRIFCLVDELKALVDDSSVAANHLARIASVGGEFGLHLILATQYPQIKMLGSAELKRNVTTRLCGKVDDAGAAANALGMPDSGAEDLQGYGDFLLRDFSGLTRLTVAQIEERHVAALPRGEAKSLDLSEVDAAASAPDLPKAHYHDPDPFEPGPLAMALFEPMGINRLARTIKDRGLAETFSNDKARRYLEFAGLMWEAARQMGYLKLPPSHPGLPSGIRD